MTHTDFTTASMKPHAIMDANGEQAGEAPGIDARHALETFNRDALEGEGALIYSEEAEEWGLLFGDDHFSAYAPKTAENIADRIGRQQDLSALEREYTSLEQILTVTTTQATRDLALGRMGELRNEIVALAKTTPAASKQADLNVTGELLSRAMLHLDENLHDGIREMWLIATEHALASDENDERPSVYTVAARVTVALEALVYGTDEEHPPAGDPENGPSANDIP